LKQNGLTVSLSLLEFGQLRPSPEENERYKISWRKDGVLATKYDDQVSITLPIEEAKGVWTVDVQLLTDEVKKDLHGDLYDSATFKIQ
jgi:hypothetical protein